MSGPIKRTSGVVVGVQQVNVVQRIFLSDRRAAGSGGGGDGGGGGRRRRGVEEEKEEKKEAETGKEAVSPQTPPPMFRRSSRWGLEEAAMEVIRTEEKAKAAEVEKEEEKEEEKEAVKEPPKDSTMQMLDEIMRSKGG